MRTIHGAIPSWPGIARRRTGVLPNALCPGHPRRPMAPQSPIPSAPCRLSIWAACKPDHVDGRGKPGHDGKCHGNQRLTRLFLVSDSEAIQTEPRLETPGLDRFALLAMTESALGYGPLSRPCGRGLGGGAGELRRDP